MFLFIFESIGTSELILIGIIALVFLGPRKLPGMARMIGKMMAEFRGTASEFRETWKREVNFEEEARAFDLNALESEPVARVDSIPTEEPTESPAAPAIKEIDPASFKHLVPPEKGTNEITESTDEGKPSDKKNWL